MLLVNPMRMWTSAGRDKWQKGLEKGGGPAALSIILLYIPDTSLPVIVEQYTAEAKEKKKYTIRQASDVFAINP